MDTQVKPNVTIAVLTYRRPTDLAAILPALAAQLTSAADMVGDSRILVVDNSPEGDAEPAVSAFAADNPWSVRVDYENEKRPGIPAARNRALDAARACDVLVFIDDDERPTDGWLTNLLHARADQQASAVVGPVISEFAIDPPEWIAAGRFFERRRLQTGTVLTVAATNNLLVDVAPIQSAALRFDEKMGMNGGDDTLFTRQLAGLGRMVWCDEAVVIDVVPEARISRRWVIRRALRSGNSWSLTSIRLAPAPLARLTTRVRASGDGLVRIAGGAGLAACGVVTRRLGQRARGTRTCARGIGMVLGAVGLSYLEYARPAAKGARRIERARA
jgi:glycosyltransferase involved in cell wall biosynthesis